MMRFNELSLGSLSKTKWQEQEDVIKMNKAQIETLD